MEDRSVDVVGWDGAGETRVLRLMEGGEGGEEGERRGLGERGVGSVAFEPVISLCVLDGEGKGRPG